MQGSIEASRLSIEIFDKQFARLHKSSSLLLEAIPEDLLYVRRHMNYTCGELILRSASVVEKACAGITTNLWDDPFEWTLPESLSTRNLIKEYLNEVERTRLAAFSLFLSDADLKKRIVTPRLEIDSPFGLLTDTLEKASYLQGCAASVASSLSEIKPNLY
jgi:hypothetical protein